MKLILVPRKESQVPTVWPPCGCKLDGVCQGECPDFVPKDGCSRGKCPVDRCRKVDCKRCNRECSDRAGGKKP